MSGFGYKIGWFAIHSTDIDTIISTLNLKPYKNIGIEEGIEIVYEKNDLVFIAPATSGWTFVIGRWAIGTGEEEGVHAIEDLISQWSRFFGEVLAFATFRVIEYHHWMWAKEGNLIRSFAFIGDSGEILTNEGELTPVENQFEWGGIEECLWSPNEENVLDIASAWGGDPEDLDYDVETGVLAYAPS